MVEHISHISCRYYSPDISQYVVFYALSAAASEVPQAAGRNPTAEGAPQPEGRAHHTAGARD